MIDEQQKEAVRAKIEAMKIELSLRQEKAIEALLVSPSVAKAAEASGIPGEDDKALAPGGRGLRQGVPVRPEGNPQPRRPEADATGDGGDRGPTPGHDLRRPERGAPGRHVPYHS
jgi:hypothetical protein